MTYSCDCYSLPLPPSQLTIYLLLSSAYDGDVTITRLRLLCPPCRHLFSLILSHIYLSTILCLLLTLPLNLPSSFLRLRRCRNNHTLSPFVTTLSPNNYYPRSLATLTSLQSESCACYSLLSTYFLLSSAYAGDTRTLSPSVHSLIMITLAPQPTCILYNSYSLSLLLPFSLQGLRSDYATTPLHLQPNLPPTNYSSSSATVTYLHPVLPPHSPSWLPFLFPPPTLQT